MQDTVLSPSDFVGLLNQTLEFAYPSVTIEGELSEFRVSKNRFVYFNLADDQSSVKFFGTVYNLPGPLEDGLMLRVTGSPKLHNRFGFSINVRTIQPVGEGSLKKAADLLAKKLAVEGLFAPERKRLLPAVPEHIGLITAANSAAYADFTKILNERWGGVDISYIDSYVQGEQAPAQLVAAIEQLNRLPKMPEVLVITRGGGSAEDLAAFNDERVVRAVSASRIPTLVAIGHEIDLSLSEMAADARASTPTNAAQSVVPDRRQVLAALQASQQSLSQTLQHILERRLDLFQSLAGQLGLNLQNRLAAEAQKLDSRRRLIKLFDPQAALRRGYAIVSKGAKHISSIKQLKPADQLAVRLADGTISAKVEKLRG